MSFQGHFLDLIESFRRLFIDFPAPYDGPDPPDNEPASDHLNDSNNEGLRNTATTTEERGDDGSYTRKDDVHNEENNSPG
mmetsp:Transcript_65770/g.77311  ORF Transcript_65770/g.77311 Transcript_65770/m.77311 type:complete len:80 (-) Transcript_65770:54-293(-)|eukprot:CAMPEP_0194373572 /NCGR_PEP_ID=MMETSP0174-20130528/22059_1 /TAXON_ID=216777 /ORGANISM="Proboscia alata, Strain PI-D3" /LENGTH=79 /DNA_ID=CAMNT_0039152753 /DNA_START=347 /DNA_END=586 /DNA_ORIENTATION=+